MSTMIDYLNSEDVAKTSYNEARSLLQMLKPAGNISAREYFDLLEQAELAMNEFQMPVPSGRLNDIQLENRLSDFLGGQSAEFTVSGNLSDNMDVDPLDLDLDGLIFNWMGLGPSE